MQTTETVVLFGDTSCVLRLVFLTEVTSTALNVLAASILTNTYSHVDYLVLRTLHTELSCDVVTQICHNLRCQNYLT